MVPVSPRDHQSWRAKCAQQSAPGRSISRSRPIASLLEALASGPSHNFPNDSFHSPGVIECSPDGSSLSAGGASRRITKVVKEIWIGSKSLEYQHCTEKLSAFAIVPIIQCICRHAVHHQCGLDITTHLWAGGICTDSLQNGQLSDIIRDTKEFKQRAYQFRGNRIGRRWGTMATFAVELMVFDLPEIILRVRFARSLMYWPVRSLTAS